MWSASPMLPYLPVVTVDVTFPNTSGYTTLGAVTTTIGLAAALTSAASQCDTSGVTGVIIPIPAGTVITGNFPLPASNCTTDEIIIQTSGLSFPARGTRLDPSNATYGTGHMARITETGNNPMFCDLTDCTGSVTPTPGINNYRFYGIEFDENSAYPSITNYGIFLGYYQTTPTNLPTHIIFDHCYLHAHATTLLAHGIFMDGNSIAWVDGYISEAHHNNDSQAILMFSGGPKLIQNSFIEATTENILTGGGLDQVLNRQPWGLMSHDAQIFNNLIYKETSWNGWSGRYDGSWFTQYPNEKNIYEQKGGVRYDFENNVLMNAWGGGQPGQCMLVQMVLNNLSGGVFTVHSSDITFRNNLCVHAPGGFAIVGRDPVFSGDFGAGGGTGVGVGIGLNLDPVHRVDRIYIENNVFDDNGQFYQGRDGLGYWNQFSLDTNAIIFDHNTVASTYLSGAAFLEGNAQPNHNFWLTNSIWNATSFTNTVENTTSITFNNAALSTEWLGAPNRFFGLANIGQSCVANTGLPTGFSCPANPAAVSFTNYNSGNGGDYTLVPGSTYSATGTSSCTVNPDGTGAAADCGANIAAVAAATAGVATLAANPPTITSLTPNNIVCNGSNTVTITGTNLNAQGVDFTIRGLSVTASSVTATSAVVTPPNITTTAAITFDQADNMGSDGFNGIGIFTSGVNSFFPGDVISISGTSNHSGYFNVSNYTMFTGPGLAVFSLVIPPTVTINGALHLAKTADTGTATLQSIPITVANYGLHSMSPLTCN